MSDDALYSATVTGDGKTMVKSVTDAASMLYNLYVVAPAMRNEVDVSFTRYIGPEQRASSRFCKTHETSTKSVPNLWKPTR